MVSKYKKTLKNKRSKRKCIKGGVNKDPSNNNRTKTPKKRLKTINIYDEGGGGNASGARAFAADHGLNAESGNSNEEWHSVNGNQSSNNNWHNALERNNAPSGSAAPSSVAIVAAPKSLNPRAKTFEYSGLGSGGGAHAALAGAGGGGGGGAAHQLRQSASVWRPTPSPQNTENFSIEFMQSLLDDPSRDMFEGIIELLMRNINFRGEDISLLSRRGRIIKSTQNGFFINWGIHKISRIHLSIESPLPTGRQVVINNKSISVVEIHLKPAHERISCFIHLIRNKDDLFICIVAATLDTRHIAQLVVNSIIQYYANMSITLREIDYAEYMRLLG
jgi:hypothetical protein